MVEAVGRVAVLEMAFDATRRGGTTVAAGLPAPDKVMALSPLRLVAEERTLKGSYMGSGVPRRDVPRLLALARSGRLPIDRLVSGTLRLDGINEGVRPARRWHGRPPAADLRLIRGSTTRYGKSPMLDEGSSRVGCSKGRPLTDHAGHVPPIRVAIIDDHPAIVASIAAAVDAEPGMVLAGTASTRG